jgi:5'-methylthioadenosine phosphorylase
MYAIIGGSGLAKIAALESPHRRVMRTPYGEPSGALTFGRLAGRDVLFLARHGYGHTIAPHDINYRANIWALRELGAEGIFAIASVGSIRKDLGPRTLVLPHQILDYTHSRASSFVETGKPVTHVDFTHPYSQPLRERLLQAAARAGETLVDGSVYACMQGPRLETAAEIDRIERDGADIVGMTGMPEASLAREAGIEYASIAMVVNHAAGRGTSVQRIELGALEGVLRDSVARAVRILEDCVAALPPAKGAAS